MKYIGFTPAAGRHMEKIRRRLVMQSWDSLALKPDPVAIAQYEVDRLAFLKIAKKYRLTIDVILHDLGQGPSIPQ